MAVAGGLRRERVVTGLLGRERIVRRDDGRCSWVSCIARMRRVGHTNRQRILARHVPKRIANPCTCPWWQRFLQHLGTLQARGRDQERIKRLPVVLPALSTWM